jgi:hypothetical protein
LPAVATAHSSFDGGTGQLVVAAGRTDVGSEEYLEISVSNSKQAAICIFLFHCFQCILI